MGIPLLQNGKSLPELFFKNKRPHEKFGIATFNKKVLSVSFPVVQDTIEHFIPIWFKVGINETRDLHKTGWNEDRSFYPKFVLLANVYLKNNKMFEDLMNINYNPDYNNWEVHPGSGRKVVHSLFGPDTIDCITFDSTGQADIEFKVLFNSNQELQDYCLSHYGKEAYMPIRKAHDTYIPQIYFDGTRYNNDLEILYRDLQLFWKTHTLKHNVPLFQNELNHHITGGKTVNIEINDINDIMSFGKAMILAPKLTKNYRDDNMSIHII